MYDAMMEEEEVVEMGADDREMWLEREPEDLIDVNDTSIFYEDFPPLLDFPCMSSSSSSCTLSSSSSSSSLGIMKSDANEGREIILPSSSGNGIDDIDCTDVMEEVGGMELLDTNDIWDPSSIFPYENHEDDRQEQQQQEGREEQPSEDLAMVFFEWLNSNKDSISAEDLRSIKLKRSTIECAIKRLGGGKDGMKQLLKLILEWVQNHHLQRRTFENLNPNPCFSPSMQWIPNPPCVPDPTAVAVGFPLFSNEGVASQLNHYNINNHHYCSSSEYHMLESSGTRNPPHFVLPSHYNPFPDHNLSHASPPPQAFLNQYPYQLFEGHGDQKLVRYGSSATKEARKKRMARQRRVFSHHRSQNHQHHQQENQQPQNERLATDTNCRTTAQPPPVVEDRPLMQGQQYHRQITSDRHQGWKSEKNLKFLLQKVLKQSDVGNLGRIVLPKKEAETHLPELEARDGISIAMEDIGTSYVWNMRYRFWPNNKSRMYLLENTRDFVRSNELQEGDFIVIYSDMKCGKYMIRGVKVRQPGSKSEAKWLLKTQRNLHATSTAGYGSSSSSIKGTVT